MRLQTYFLVLSIICTFSFCNREDKAERRVGETKPNGQIISDPDLQDALFNNLERITRNGIPPSIRLDSLAFLILPVEASCPSCRNKTIDSIGRNIDRLDSKHIIIIQGDGIKSISGYFELRKQKRPTHNVVFYDTLGITFETNMTHRNPSIYYSYDGKVYKKINCSPSSIKRDLRNYFTFG